MPRKKKQESPQEQGERFRKAVRDMIDAGELNPTEADEEFERLIGRVTVKPTEPSDGGKT